MTNLFEGIVNKRIITPEIIKAKLFSFHNSAHSLHLDTQSYEIHMALDLLYKELVDVKDEIIEELQGYIGRRIGAVSLDPIPVYSDSEPMRLVDEIISFSGEAYSWSCSTSYINVQNKFQELQGLAAKVKFLLTLK